MRIIISPAKKMNVDTDTLPCHHKPRFLKEANILQTYLQSLTYEEAKALWKCSDHLAEKNYKCLKAMELEHMPTPAILAYEGIQYQYMAPAVLEEGGLIYLEEHLRILSGFYGILRPFDGVVPYRLEMQAKIQCGEYHSLYEFWGRKLADQLLSETNCIVNLASKEYSRAVSKYLPADIPFITCIFGEWVEGKIKEKGTLCKMARGEMVRYLAERKATSPEELKAFQGLGFHFQEALSDSQTCLFVRG